eukprot:gene16349-22548_t
MLFAPNAGLPAYMSWIPTLKLLAPKADSSGSGVRCQAPKADPSGSGVRCQAPKADPSGSGVRSGRIDLQTIPCVISDYCEEAVVKSKAMLQEICGIAPHDIHACVNSFRQPVRSTSHGNNLPAFSNGFLLAFNNGLSP